jgi:hypothetical protein
MNASEWATRINAEWRKSVEAIIETGRLLIQAKEDLGHGKWCEMFRDPRFRALNYPVPFTVRTAQMLMVIAEHPILSNAKYTSHLPPSWYTLYRLGSLPDNELLMLIEDGTIHPCLMQKEVGRIPFSKIDQFLKGLAQLMHIYRRYKGGPDVLARMIRYSDEISGVYTVFTRSELREEVPVYMRQMFEELDKLYEEDKQSG